MVHVYLVTQIFVFQVEEDEEEYVMTWTRRQYEDNYGLTNNIVEFRDVLFGKHLTFLCKPETNLFRPVKTSRYIITD